MSAGVIVLPVGGSLPLHPPEAVQASAWVAFHCSVTGDPMGTVVSLAFKVTVGAGVAATESGVLPAPEESTVSALELAPHAASEPRTANPSSDFNANAYHELWLRRIEPIRRSPKIHCDKFFGGAESFQLNL